MLEDSFTLREELISAQATKNSKVSPQELFTILNTIAFKGESFQKAAFSEGLLKATEKIEKLFN